jgi:alpha-glucosidase
LGAELRYAREVVRRALLVIVLASSGCGEDPLPTFDLPVGGDLQVTVVEGRRLRISAADGRVLLDGLPPQAIGDGPPLVGFALRDVSTHYEMQAGSFRPSEEARGPWLVADRLRDASDAAGPALALEHEDGRILGRLYFTSPSPGALVVEAAAGDGGESRLSWGFGCDAEDHFAGFGAQSWDTDHRGQSVPTLVQENGIGKADHDDYSLGIWFVQGRRHSSHLPLGQYLSRRGYVLTAETPHPSLFALCSERHDAARIEVERGTRIHVFDGPSPAAALERSSAAFGRPRMPPRVAFAPWLDAVFGSAEVRRVAERLRDEQVPASVIWTEDWRGGDFTDESYALAEEWQVDRDLYPDIEQLADDLHGLGFDFHVYFNPFVYQESLAWNEVEPNGWLVKRQDGSDYLFTGAKLTQTGLLDLFHPDARAWAVSKMRAAIELGADGWMNDFAEWLPTDAITYAGSGYDHHNRYPVAWQEVAREAIDGVGDGVERLFFGRSGWFGTPALADVIWAGDQRTTMDVDDGLPTILPIGIGLGLVGISTYGHDIAGYQAATNPGSTKEVFFRWTELGAWSPVMRTHHGNQPSLNWSWEKDSETIAHFRRYAALHMALVPWLEGLAFEASHSGLPMWRSLAIHYPEDAAVWPITDQVLVGPSVLVAPVQAPGATARDVYLPAGRWYPWQSGGAIDGGRVTRVDAPLEEIPVFARAGTVIPMYPEGVMTLVRESAAVPGPAGVADDRRVVVFLGADGAFIEASGLRYTLAHRGPDGGGSLAMEWNGVALEACGEPPCAVGDEARVEGAGTLRLAAAGAVVAELAIEGGAGDRELVIGVRR